MRRLPDAAAGSHAAFASRFAAALLDPERSTPAGVGARGGGPANLRYGVYRNNVTTSLADALGGIFPAVRRLVGDEFFAGMAVAFVRAHPPRSRLMFEYGHDFPTFVANFGPARDLPYLADVAMIERAWLDAYHAADARPLSPQDLGAIAPEDLPAAVFRPHPAMRILRARYAAYSICAANRDGQSAAAPIRGDVAEDTLVTRPGLTVTMRRLAPGAAAFLLALAGGGSFEAAIDAGFADSDEFAPSDAIGTMLEAGAFAAAGEEQGTLRQMTGAEA